MSGLLETIEDNTLYFCGLLETLEDNTLFLFPIFLLLGRRYEVLLEMLLQSKACMHSETLQIGARCWGIQENPSPSKR
jgi:hypothetical protein